MQVVPMSAPLGATVQDLDVRSVDAKLWPTLNDLFNKHHVLVFPNQDLTPADHMAFAQHWGELVPFPYGGIEGYPNIIELRNNGKKRDVNQHWHSDMTYDPTPPKLTMLYALEAPALGGETAFSNQILAYQELSDGLRDVVDGLVALHSAEELARLYGADPAEASRAEHPVVRTHDENGQRGLYVCRAFTQKFRNWSREESKALLEYLYQHSIRAEFQARHQWRPGDLVMWDNRCLLHYAVHDHADEPRIIHRLQIQGNTPT
ncbi:MAG: TauD/TfdA family dioxygenase [Gammaproteobacteria bacterium]|jgi:taurine dioxygenase|nr:TauD/TfdA family dioxygenase [Gammaproteobacteria bacterium]MBT6023927.1 TauD/TfdA family dioxygenase [Gammaproteobacteria bacterium]